MSLSAAWRRCVRPFTSPPESSRAAARVRTFAGRRAAAHLITHRLRRGLVRACCASPLILAAGGALAQEEPIKDPWLEPPTVSFKDATYTVVEDVARGEAPYRGELAVTIVQSHYRVRTNTVTITASDSGAGDGHATTGVDYEPGPFQVTIPGNTTEVTAYLKVLIDDNELEEDETFTLTLSGFTGDLIAGSQATATVTIVDDEYTVGIDPAGTQHMQGIVTQVDEDAGHAEVGIVLSRALGRDVSVDFRYPSLGAVLNGDYRKGPSSLTVPAGQTEATLRVPIIDDAIVERSEFFNVEVVPRSVPDGHDASFSHPVQIRDNDGAGLSADAGTITPTTLYEGQTRTFTIRNIPPEWGRSHDRLTHPIVTFRSGGTAQTTPGSHLSRYKCTYQGVGDYNSQGIDICVEDEPGAGWARGSIDNDARVVTFRLTALRDRETEGSETVRLRVRSGVASTYHYEFEITITDQPTEVLEIYNKERDFFWCEEPLPEVTDVFPGKDYEDLTDEEILQYLEAI